MPIAVTSIGSQADTNARSTYTCFITAAPAANALVLVTTVAGASVAIPGPSAVSGCGMIFSEVTRQAFPTGSSVTQTITVWRSMSGSPNDSVVSVLWDTTPLSSVILVDTFSGISTSGTSGANGVGSSTRSEKGNDSALTLIFPSYASTANAIYIASSHTQNNTNDNPDGNFVVIQAHNISSSNLGLKSAWTTSQTPSQATWTGAGTSSRGAIAVELVADNPAAGGAVFPGVYQNYYRSLIAGVLA